VRNDENRPLWNKGIFTTIIAGNKIIFSRFSPVKFSSGAYSERGLWGQTLPPLFGKFFQFARVIREKKS